MSAERDCTVEGDDRQHPREPLLGIAYNTALISVAAGVSWPVFGVLLSPVLAAGAMALFSVFVLGNALRLVRFRPPLGERAAGMPAPRRTPEPAVTV